MKSALPAIRTGARLAAAALVGCATLHAATGTSVALTPTITEFSAGLTNSPSGAITGGPDGNVWFTTNNSIGRISPIGTITEFTAGLNAGSDPDGIVTGPDGNLWFTDSGTTKAIGRITPDGSITEFPINATIFPGAITTGADGNLWVVDGGATKAILRITTAVVIDEFSTGLTGFPGDITTGPDGNVWFTQGSPYAIGRITPLGAITTFSDGIGAAEPYGITAGSDGNVWFSDSCSVPAIGRVTPAGSITLFTTGTLITSCPYSIGSGPDGAVWWADEGNPAAIGRAAPDGTVSLYTAGMNPLSTPVDATGGPDGNVWFTDTGAPNAIGRITTPPAVRPGTATVLGSGAADIAATVNGHSQPSTNRFEFGTSTAYGSATPVVDIGSGAADVSASAKLSGLKPDTTYHYRASTTNPTGTTAGADATFKTLALPAISSASVSPKTWRRGSALPKIAKRKRAPLGTRITFTVSRAVPVELRFFAKLRGRKSGKKCRRPTRRNRRAKRCTRLVSKGTLSFATHSGKNTVRFQGRISAKKRLAPGRYQLKIVTADPTIKQNASRTTSFTIARR
jgi:streptogramin lyase